MVYLCTANTGPRTTFSYLPPYLPKGERKGNASTVLITWPNYCIRWPYCDMKKILGYFLLRKQYELLAIGCNCSSRGRSNGCRAAGMLWRESGFPLWEREANCLYRYALDVDPCNKKWVFARDSAWLLPTSAISSLIFLRLKSPHHHHCDGLCRHSHGNGSAVKIKKWPSTGCAGTMASPTLHCFVILYGIKLKRMEKICIGHIAQYHII